MTKLPFVSVLVPVLNEADFIGRCLASLLANDYPADRFEVLVLDGMSTDGTREIVEEIGREHPNVKLLDNPERLQSHAMNLGIECARGEIIIRVDGHVEVPTNFLSMSVKALLEHPECACAGGVIENVSETPEGEAISLAMSSPFGVGNARFRLGNYEGYVDTLAFGAYRKAALYEVGLIDTTLARNEDDELHFRILQAGYKIWCTSKIRSKYYVRPSYSKLFRQYYQYGYWKVYVNRKRKAVTSLRQLAPVVLVLTLGVLALSGVVWPLARRLLLMLLALYFVLALVFAWQKVRSPLKMLRVILAFVTLHLAYGLGYLEGLWQFFVLGRESSDRRAEVTR